MIFINNKYTKWYYNIITNAQSREIAVNYTEKHHIIPDCFFINRTRPGAGGSVDGNPNATENLVKLSAREHFICHWLLTKMTCTKRTKYQMWNALSSMMYWHNELQSRIKIGSKKYEMLKVQISSQKSIFFSGGNASMLNKKHSDKTRQLMKDIRSDPEYRKQRAKSAKEYAANLSAELKAERYAKSSLKQKGIPREKIICPHCNKAVGGPGPFAQYHGNNCKSLNR